MYTVAAGLIPGLKSGAAAFRQLLVSDPWEMTERYVLYIVKS